MDQITSFFYGHIPDFLWGLAAFVIFVVILLKVGVKQVLAAVDAREAKIRGDLSEAEQAKASAKLVKTELEAKIKAHEVTHRGAIIKAVLRLRIRHIEPLLQEIDAQHPFNPDRRAAAFARGVMGLNQS